MSVRGFLTNLALVLGSLFVVLLAVEIVLRLTVYNFKPYAKSPGANAVYIIETEEFKTRIQTNSLNMRDVEILPKETGEFRVLCLGDSFTFGLGVNVPEAYPKIAEKILRENGDKVTVINGGTQGNIKDATEFFLERGVGFEPDWVVAQVYIGNDFYDWTRTPEPGDQALKSAPAEPAPNPVLSRLKRWIKSIRLCTLDFLWTRLIQFHIIDDWLYRTGLRYDNQGIFLREYPPLEQKLVERELAAIGRLQKLCDARGIGFSLLLVPTKQQITKKHFLNNDKYAYTKPNEILREFCRENKIGCVDFLEIYESMPEREVERFYYVRDRHWTVAGHASAGRRLAEFLKGRPLAGGDAARRVRPKT